MYSYDFEKTTQPKASKENKGMQDYLKLFNNRKTRNNIKQHGILSSGKGGFSNSNPLYSSENNDILKISKNGENDVIEIQDGLDLAGFTNADGTRIKKDGIFGAKTQDAYNKFWNKTYPTEPNYLKNSSKWFQLLSSSNAINNDNEPVKTPTPRISGATAAVIAGINAAKPKPQEVSAGTSAAIAGASAAAKPIPQSGSAAVAGTTAGATAIAPQQPFGEANAENLFPTPVKMPNTDLNDDIFYYWMKKTGIPQFNLQLNPADTETEDYLEGLKSIDKNLAYREKPKELLSTIQTALTRFGYTGKDGKPLTGDGIYDENTASALSEFLEDEDDTDAGIQKLSANLKKNGLLTEKLNFTNWIPEVANGLAAMADAAYGVVEDNATKLVKDPVKYFDDYFECDNSGHKKDENGRHVEVGDVINDFLEDSSLIQFEEQFEELTREGKLDNTIKGTLGAWRDEKGIFHITPTFQQLKPVGYNDLYDKVFDTATKSTGTSMDRDKLQFTGEDGKKYVLWTWKGDYLNLGAGAETGIYVEGIGDHWFTAPEKAMPMTLKLINKKTGEEIYDYKPNENQWWITGFDANTPDMQEDELISITEIDFSSNPELWEGVVNSLNN